MLEQEFDELANAIREAVTKSKEANSLVTIREVSVRRPDFSLKYRADFGFGNFKPTRIEQDLWDWHDQERFESATVESLQEFKCLATILADKLDWVRGFARTIAAASFHGLDDPKLKEFVNSIGRQLDGLPLPVTVTAFIDGISICDSPLVISDRIILRHPTPEDVAQYVILDELGGLFLPPLGQTWFSVIGEFVFDALNTGPAQKEFLRTMNALRLFRVAGVASNHYKMRSGHAPFLVGTMTNNGLGPRSRFNCTLSAADSNSLNKFLHDILPFLPDPFHRDKIASEKEIAYTRYTDALFQEGSSEREITSAITALEALFLQNESGITHRLAQRIALFLRVLGTHPDAQITYEIVRKGYKIRSKFIHGDSLKPEERPQADTLAPVLLEYARKSVLVFFQLPTSKNEILKELDRAMIDQGSVGSLETLLAPAVYR